MSDDIRYQTSIGTSDPDTITLLGKDLSADLMGQIGFAELAYWLIVGHRPTPGQVKVFETVLVTLADHGLTPTAIATRVTYLSAPDSIQGALASGLLGGGSRFLGVTEDTGRFLAAALESLGEAPETLAGWTDEQWDEVAERAVRQAREAGSFVPGLGHPMHKQGDPRTPVIIRIAHEAGVHGPHLSLFEAIGRVHHRVLGKSLPLNGAGVCGAALADAGVPGGLLRGVALLARAAGLLGHISEEIRHPIAMQMYRLIEEHADYVPPAE